MMFLPKAGNRQGRVGFELLGQSYKPSTATVLSAGFWGGLEAEGSAIQDVATSVIARETGNEDQLGFWQSFSEGMNFLLMGALTPDEVDTVESKPLTEDEWKKSEYFREDLTYLPNTTTLSAAITANTRDRKAERDFILQRASGLQSVGGFLSGMVGSMADAKALPANVAAAVAAPFTAGLSVGVRAGVAGTAGVRGLITGATSAGVQAIRATRTTRALAIAAESTVATLPSVITGVQNAPLIQQEYDVGDATLDLLASAGLSVGLQAAGDAVGAAWRRYGRPEQSLDVGVLAAQQVRAGERIDVAPVVRAGVADFTPSRMAPETPVVREVDVGGGIKLWEAALSGEVIRGKTRVEVEAAAREIGLSESLEVAKQSGYSPEAVAQIENLLRAKEVMQPEAIRQRLVESSPEVQAKTQILRQAEAKLEAAKPASRKSAESKVAKARGELEQARARAVEAGEPSIQRARQQLAAREQEVDAAIRAIQTREAAKRMPDFVKRQLDDTPQGQASRAADPNAIEVQRDRVEQVRYDDDAPVKPLEESEMMQLREAAKTDPQIAKYLESVELMKRHPDAVLQYAKCRAGL